MQLLGPLLSETVNRERLLQVNMLILLREGT